MANIQLKTLKFPGLADTYVIPEVSAIDENSDGNIKITFSIPASKISFYIDGTSYLPEVTKNYEADPGMTWEAWMNSSDCPLSIAVGGPGLVVAGEYGNNGVIYNSSDNNFTQPSDIIVENASYYLGM